MTGPAALLLAVLLPTAAGGLVALAGARPNLRDGLSLAAGAATFAVVLTLVPSVAAGRVPEAVLLEVVPGLDLAFHAEHGAPVLHGHAGVVRRRLPRGWAVV